jgi:hypothetical protein
MDFLNGHMDYNMDFALTFQCIYYDDFISILFIWTQYMIHDGEKLWIENKYNKNFNQHNYGTFE